MYLVQSLRRIVFLLIALIYVGGMIYQVGYFTYFKINQEEIVAEHCVNKDKPEMHCNGQCHLKKELEKAQVIKEDNSNEEPQSRLPQINLEFLIAVLPEVFSYKSNTPDHLIELVWHSEENISSAYSITPWHPPKV